MKNNGKKERAERARRRNEDGAVVGTARQDAMPAEDIMGATPSDGVAASGIDMQGEGNPSEEAVAFGVSPEIGGEAPQASDPAQEADHAPIDGQDTTDGDGTGDTTQKTSVSAMIRSRQNGIAQKPKYSCDDSDGVPSGGGNILKQIIASRKPQANKITPSEEIHNRVIGRKHGSSVTQIIFDRKFKH